MAIIKSYTDLSQSKTLAKILPLESADMYYFRQIDDSYFPPNVESICPIPLFKDGKEDFNYDIRCWSLAALLKYLSEIKPQEYTFTLTINEGKWCFGLMEYGRGYIRDEFNDNPIDACYEMILKLHEFNLL